MGRSVVTALSTSNWNNSLAETEKKIELCSQEKLNFLSSLRKEVHSLLIRKLEKSMGSFMNTLKREQYNRKFVVRRFDSLSELLDYEATLAPLMKKSVSVEVAVEKEREMPEVKNPEAKAMEVHPLLNL